MSMLINSFGVAAGYTETSFIGTDPASTGSSTFSLANDFKSIVATTVPSGGVWVKTFKIRMSTSTSGDKIKPVLYSGIISSSTLVKTGQELILPTVGSDTTVTANWNSDGSAYFIPAGSYGLGLITLTNGCFSTAGTTYWTADAYSDGPADPFGSVSSSPKQIICWCPSSPTGP